MSDTSEYLRTDFGVSRTNVNEVKVRLTPETFPGTAAFFCVSGGFGGSAGLCAERFS